MRKICKEWKYSIPAAGLFVLLFMVSFFRGEMFHAGEKAAGENSRQEYTVVMLGDSIFGQIRDETSVANKLQELIGKPVFNGAFGGTQMSRGGNAFGSSAMEDAFSMVSLSKALVSGDFRIQEKHFPAENGTEHFPDTIAELQEIDLNRVEVLLIGHGLNDYHSGVSVESAEIFDEYSFVGALRSTVEVLQRGYPELRIVLVTSPYTWYHLNGLTCEEYVREGNVLEDYVNAELALAEEMSLEVLDLYHGYYPHEEWKDWSGYTSDGVHPNEAGRTLLAEALAEIL